MLGIAHKDAALAEQPQRAEQRLLVGRLVRQIAAYQVGPDRKEWRRLLRHEFPKGRARLKRLPVEDAHIFAEIVACGHRPQLSTNETPQRRLAREHAWVRCRVIILHQCPQRRLQYGAVKLLLAAKMVVDRGLI